MQRAEATHITLTLMMEMEAVSETFDANSIFIRLFARGGNFILCSLNRHEIFDHNIAETKPVSVISFKGGKIPAQFFPLERAALIHVISS
jgi:hypothetical protein